MHPLLPGPASPPPGSLPGYQPQHTLPGTRARSRGGRRPRSRGGCAEGQNVLLPSRAGGRGSRARQSAASTRAWWLQMPSRRHEPKPRSVG